MVGTTGTSRGSGRSPGPVAGSVITPEAVRLDYVVGGIATRTLAKLVDIAALAAVGVILQALVRAGGSVLLEREVLAPETVDIVQRILIAVVVFFVGIFLVPLCETRWNGRTPGKALLGLRVVTDVGETVGFGHALIRSLIQLVELPTGIALVAALSNPRNQRLGDLSAGTFVIHDRGQLVAPLLTPTVFPPPPGCWPVIAAIDVSSMTTRQFTFIRDFLLRSPDLTPDARQALGWDLVMRLGPRLGAWPPAGMAPERFVNCVASAYQLRYFDGVLPPTAER